VSLAPILNAPAVVQMHLAGALLALLIGVSVMLMKKGTTAHVLMGRVWAGLMIFVALSSFWIINPARGHFSPIHLLSVATLISVPRAIIAKRQGKIKLHATVMISVFAGLVIAGAFTLLPARILGKAVFGG